MTQPVVREEPIRYSFADPDVPRSPEDPYSVELAELDVCQPHLFETGDSYRYFERLRNEAPVHFCPRGEFGPYWSLTKYKDVQKVDTNHRQFSSEGGITVVDPAADFTMPMFIAMDPPKHDQQRREVSPVAGPRNLAVLQHEIRERVCNILDSLPRNEEFNWVEKVSIELTTQMLATIFDFPFEERLQTDPLVGYGHLSGRAGQVWTHDRKTVRRAAVDGVSGVFHESAV